MAKRKKKVPPPIQFSWERFLRDCISDEASDIQKSEMRKAFYMGASSLFMIMTNAVSNGDPDEVTDSDLKLMDMIEKEILAFGDEFDRDGLGIGKN